MARDRAAVRWRGAGGRWFVWVARAVLWAVVLLVGYRGVLAIVAGPAAPARGGRPASSTAATSRRRFPATAAEAYALEFGEAYLNFSPATATARALALAAFLPPGADPQLGWNGVGSQRVLDEQVAGVVVSSAHSALVTLLAQVGSGSLVELGVPIYAAGTGMSVSGDPALLPGPAKAVARPAGRPADRATEAALRSQLAGFFPAYASGDQATLDRFVTPGAHITGLGGAVSFGGIDAVYAPEGGTTRTVSVTLTWRLPAPPGPRAATASAPAAGSAPAAVQMTYAMTVVRRGRTWDVRSIGASASGRTAGPR